jgi:hypothetical protein
MQKGSVPEISSACSRSSHERLAAVSCVHVAESRLLQTSAHRCARCGPLHGYNESDSVNWRIVSMRRSVTVQLCNCVRPLTAGVSSVLLCLQTFLLFSPPCIHSSKSFFLHFRNTRTTKSAACRPDSSFQNKSRQVPRLVAATKTSSKRGRFPAGANRTQASFKAVT